MLVFPNSFFFSHPDEKYKRREFDPNAPGLKGLQWDGADLYMVGYGGERGGAKSGDRKTNNKENCTFCDLSSENELLHFFGQLTATETMNYDDAFTLEQV